MSMDIYLEKYAIQHGISKEEAKNHAMVKEAEKYYADNKRKDKAEEKADTRPQFSVL